MWHGYVVTISYIVVSGSSHPPSHYTFSWRNKTKMQSSLFYLRYITQEDTSPLSEIVKYKSIILVISNVKIKISILKGFCCCMTVTHNQFCLFSFIVLLLLLPTVFSNCKCSVERLQFQMHSPKLWTIFGSFHSGLFTFLDKKILICRNKPQCTHWFQIPLVCLLTKLSFFISVTWHSSRVNLFPWCWLIHCAHGHAQVLNRKSSSEVWDAKGMEP